METTQTPSSLNTLFLLATIILVLAVSLALLSAAWLMVSHLLFPDRIVPSSGVGFVCV